MDENGVVLLTYSYNAWGEVSFTATDMDSLVLAATLSNVNPFTYRGYCYDYDIDMYYLQSRYYDPEICRFINADSTDYLGATGTLLSYNLFAYCENDGVNFVDETGCVKKKDIIVSRGYPNWKNPFKNVDNIFYDPNAIPYDTDFANLYVWATLVEKAEKSYPDGAAFYRYFLNSKNIGIYLYDYTKAYKEDLFIKSAVNKIIKQLKKYAKILKEHNDEWYAISTSLVFVETISMNWSLALGGHWIGAFADVIYNSQKRKYTMEYWIIAIDRYNFDKGKTFLGIPDDWNGRFVELGWAKFFTSIGIMGGTKTWRK